MQNRAWTRCGGLVTGMFALATVTSVVRAQSFNVDIDAASGQGAGVPSTAFGAAANQAGVWNAAPVANQFATLVDVSGATTGVQMYWQTTTGTASSSGWPCATCAFSPDFEKLISDQVQVPVTTSAQFGGENHLALTFMGLQNGLYDVYTYIPRASGVVSVTPVTVNGVQRTASSAGAPLSDGFVLNANYTLHTAAVTNGALVVDTVVFSNSVDSSNISGIQLVKRGTGTCSDALALHQSPPNAANPLGLSPYVRIPSHSDFNFQQFTLEATITPENVPAFQNACAAFGAQAIVSRAYEFWDHLGGDASWALYWNKSNQTISLEVSNSWFANAHTVLTSSVTVPPGTTARVTGTFDGATLRLYVNGVPAGSMPVSTTQTDPQCFPGGVWTCSPAGDVLIGAGNQRPLSPCATNDDARRRFNGLIDDVRVWRRALSASEVQQFHCTPPANTNIDIVAAYDFSSQSLDDRSSGGTHDGVWGAPNPQSGFYTVLDSGVGTFEQQCQTLCAPPVPPCATYRGHTLTSLDGCQFLGDWSAGDLNADLDDDGDIGNGFSPDGGVDINDLLSGMAAIQRCSTNDNCAGALTVSGFGRFNYQTCVGGNAGADWSLVTVGARATSGVVGFASNIGGSRCQGVGVDDKMPNDLWYLWRSPVSGLVLVNTVTIGANPVLTGDDTGLAVYGFSDPAGTRVPVCQPLNNNAKYIDEELFQTQPRTIAYNQDSGGPNNRQARLAFRAHAGNYYLLQIAGVTPCPTPSTTESCRYFEILDLSQQPTSASTVIVPANCGASVDGPPQGQPWSYSLTPSFGPAKWLDYLPSVQCASVFSCSNSVAPWCVLYTLCQAYQPLHYVIEQRVPNNVTKLQMKRFRVGHQPANGQWVNARSAINTSQRRVIYVVDSFSPFAFEPLTCPADFDEDGGVTIEDLIGFLALFEQGSVIGDMDGDDGVTIEDLLEYLTAFEAGC